MPSVFLFQTLMKGVYIYWTITYLYETYWPVLKRSKRYGHVSSCRWECFYIRLPRSSMRHHHNKGFRRQCWTDFHLALCVGESHLVFGVGAEGSKPSCPDWGETAFLCNPLSFTDVIHVQIIPGPIVHMLRLQVLAESSDKCNGKPEDNVPYEWKGTAIFVAALIFIHEGILTLHNCCGEKPSNTYISISFSKSLRWAGFIPPTSAPLWSDHKRLFLAWRQWQHISMVAGYLLAGSSN